MTTVEMGVPKKMFAVQTVKSEQSGALIIVSHVLNAVEFRFNVWLLADNRLVQMANFTSAAIFPVVADPFWILALMLMGHLTRHAVTQAVARGISQALIR